MAIYTLYDNSQVRLPDGLSDEYATNLIAKAFPSKAANVGEFYSWDKEFNNRGVKNLDLRFGGALAHGPAETKLFLDDRVGESNWGVAENGALYVTNDGLRAIGEEVPLNPDGTEDTRKNFLESLGFDFYDLADAAPEIAIVGAAIAAETIPIPGSGAAGAAVARGMLSRLISRVRSPGLVARNLRAGAGAAAASGGLEGVQELRGHNLESVDKILGRAGIEGLAIAGLGMAIGLPISGLASLTGKIGQVAKEQGGKIPQLTRGQPLVASDVVAAEARVRARLQQSVNPNTGQQWTDVEISEIMPLVTLRELLPAGGFSSKFLVILEGRGSKELGELLPAKALQFAQKYNELVRGAEKANKPVEVMYAELKNSLTKTELAQVNNAVKNIKEFYNNMGMSGEMSVGQITNLIARNIEAQHKHGMGVFGGEKFYGSSVLMADTGSGAGIGLSKINISNKALADMVNTISRELDVPAATVKVIMESQTTKLGTAATENLFRNAVEIKPTGGITAGGEPASQAFARKAVSVKRKSFWNPRTQQQEFTGTVKTPNMPFTAREMSDLARGLREAVYNRNSITPSQVRNSAIITPKVQGLLAKSVEGVEGLGTYSTQLKAANKAYAEWIAPHTILSKKNIFTETSAQNPPQYLDSLLRGRKKDTFEEVVATLDRAIKSTEKIGRAKTLTGSSELTMTTDQLLGTVAQQYMRWTKNKYGLNNEVLATAQISDLRRNAQAALKHFDDIKAVENTASWNKASGRLLDLPGMREYRTALQEIAKGNTKGLARLRQALSYDEAGALVEQIGKVGGNLSGGGLPGVAASFQELKVLARQVSEVNEKQVTTSFNDWFYAQVWSRVLEIGGVEPAKANGMFKAWADDILKANQVSGEALHALLGKGADDMIDFATLIRGAFNIDPTAGAISAAGMPISAIRQVLNFSAVGALKPVALMYTMRQFGPGGPIWGHLRAAAGYPVPGLKTRSVKLPVGMRSVDEAANTIEPMAGKATTPDENQIDVIAERQAAAQTQQPVQNAPAGVPQMGPVDAGMGFSNQQQQMAQLGESIVNMMNQVNLNRQAISVTDSLKAGEQIAAKNA